MADDLSVRYADLLSGSFDCAGRIVLNAFLPFGCSPGGFRTWWRALHDGSDEHLDDTRLMRMAGRFGRRVRWGRVGRSAGHLLQARQAHWLIAGLTVGIISATRARSLFDRFSTVAVLIGLSMPVFVIGELLILVVFLPLNEHGFHWIQTGYCRPSQGLGDWFGHMILPWITLAAVQAAVYSRLSRGQLLDTLGEDYIRTARAKGLSERRVIFRQTSGEAAGGGSQAVSLSAPTGSGKTIMATAAIERLIVGDEDAGPLPEATSSRSPTSPS
jgi:hypothetical protein